MAKGKSKVKTLQSNGIKAETLDGLTWRWHGSDLNWQWCKLGHVYLIGAKNSVRVYWAKTLPEALAFTVGVGVGVSYHRDPSVLEGVGNLPSGAANGQDTNMSTR